MRGFTRYIREALIVGQFLLISQSFCILGASCYYLTVSCYYLTLCIPFIVLLLGRKNMPQKPFKRLPGPII